MGTMMDGGIDGGGDVDGEGEGKAGDDAEQLVALRDPGSGRSQIPTGGYNLRDASGDRLPPAARAAGPAERARLVVRMRLLDAAARGDEAAIKSAAEDVARAKAASKEAASHVEYAGMGGRVRNVIKPLVRPRIPKARGNAASSAVPLPRSFRALRARRAIIDAVEEAEVH